MDKNVVLHHNHFCIANVE